MSSLPPPPPPPISALTPTKATFTPTSPTAVTPRTSKTSQSSDQQRLDSLLNSDNFSASLYLNLALSSISTEDESDEDEMQRRMAELALQLQLRTQSCHDEIGRIGAELRAILPRCAADAGRLQSGLAGMKDDATSLLQCTASTSQPNKKGGDDEEDVEEESSSAAVALDTLSTLHSLRTNLSLTKSILSAASTWDTTLSTVPSLLSTSRLSEAVSALATLESGARALHKMPGKKERDTTLLDLRQKIEVLLKPQLLHALEKMDTRLGPLQQCVVMYAKLGKMEGLMKEYVRQRPGQVHREWFAYNPTVSSKEEEDALADDIEREMESDWNEDPMKVPTKNVVRVDPAAAFVGWLPTWYENVLNLLTEERRRGRSVFGDAIAPEIVAGVLEECFRPLLGSFQSRLSSICPSSPPSSSEGSNNVGSFESICALYESTLQFLALAYDQMIGWDETTTSNNSSVESPTGHTLSPAELQEKIHTVFRTVASPFSTYQKRFTALEKFHSNKGATLVSKDIQLVVSGRNVGVTLASLQDVMERLVGLSSFMFPLAEAAMARFELLNCGYNAPSALSTIDNILANHAGELTIAISTLTANITADENRLADSFDEQHIQYALEVLRVAGSFRRDLRMFEQKTKVRLRSLCGRMHATIVQDEELKKAVAASSSAHGAGDGIVSSSSSLTPDSLSAMEVGSMLGKEVCGDKEGDKVDDGTGMMRSPSLVKLQQLATSEKDAKGTSTSSMQDVSLYPSSAEGASRLAGNCHEFVFDICSAVPRRSLRAMSSLPVWGEEGESGDAIESYGILPQQYITQVGEHVLALVQALEPFASSADALSLANEVMSGVHAVAIQPWREFLVAAMANSGSGIGDSIREEDVVLELMKGQGLGDYLLSDHDGGFEEEDEDHEEDADDSVGAAFCNEWLDVVGSAVTGRLLERTMRISHLSQRGCEHLAADYNYLMNVFSALGLSGHPHPLLKHFGSLVVMDRDDLKANIMSRRTKDGTVGVIRAAEVRMAHMRGVDIS
uniref:Conserved oligomeric Golgi complex subunit 7 n=1 Tax=Ditylum brightwellii TaxID=49249 RepID=A0A6U3QI04_9STRA|mmetsp:Transcript_20657/g.30696  ORF Transcript_20657/g.30696 Transcript_20657/m.30696 type:complete len:1017 (+) Transcript_20657:57-3107(+)